MNPDPQVLPLLAGHNPALVQVPALPMLPQDARTYAALYAAQAPLAYPDGYGPYMAHFAPDSNFTEAALLDHVASNTTILQGFLRPSRFFPDLTGAPTE
jgi:hypothetical protein